MRSHHTATQYVPKINLSLHSTEHITIYNGILATMLKTEHKGAHPLVRPASRYTYGSNVRVTKKYVIQINYD